MPELKSSGLKFDRITIAWDGSRVAARALADALPLVGTAASISVVQIVGDKDLSRAASAADAVRNLTLHGLKAEAIELPLQGGDAGVTIQAFCQRHASNLLVMGAFGHSRAREFVLGGVTRTILDNPQLPVLLSH
ncbi:universal stress protein [Sphingopyxis sp.]|uniref:universal stress protein n=1 Tax=Sphingopyxis sp. TaxID=1908224 RepID=UPI0025E3B741|nr:universal stress protein [Sphingopyxis sp.]